jgi:tetratricopeptide (TPR) repeat protein
MNYKFKILIAQLVSLLLVLNLVQAQTAEDYLKSGNQKLKADQFLEAKKEYEKALKLNPQLAKAHHNLGDVFYILGEYPQALSSYTQAIHISPQDAEPYCSRASLYFEMRKLKEAQADVNKAIELKPDFVNAHFLSGNIHFALNQKSEACQDWKQALAFGHPEARAKIEKNCANLVQIAPPRELKIVKKKPQTANEYFNAGEKKLEYRDYEGAIKDFNLAIELDSQYAEAFFGLGSAKFAQGNHDEACQHWRKALELGYKKAQEMLSGVCNN